MRNAAFFGSADRNAIVYAQGRREIVESRTNLYPHCIDSQNFDEHVAQLQQLEVIFSTWGMPRVSPEQIEQLPNLKAVFYAAGSVQGFARPLLERGITVVSGWAANGVPVAEWTLAQILLANKGYFRNEREYQQLHRRASHGRGNFGATVSLLGAGVIGRLVLSLLKPFHLNVCVFDPFLSAETAAELGVTKVELHEAFECGNVVSNHLANLPATVGMITGEHLRAMPRNATFINTGRGATIRETEMIEVLQQRPDLIALLDVTDPEPPRTDSPLWGLPNAFLTSHIAGSIGDEVVRMADYIIEEFAAWERGEPLRYSVSLEMLETMA